MLLKLNDWLWERNLSFIADLYAGDEALSKGEKSPTSLRENESRGLQSPNGDVSF